MANLTEREFEQFSAYLDGQLSPADAKRLEERLRANPEWRLAIEELAATRKLLRSAKRFRAPRNFTISEETARSLARKPLFPVLPAFRFSAALAVVSLIAAISLQVVGLGRSAVNMVAMAPEALDAQPAITLQWAEAPQFSGGDGTGLSAEAAKGGVGSGPSGGIVTYGDASAPPLATGMGGMGGGGGGGDGGMLPGAISLPPNAVASEDSALAQAAPAPAEGEVEAPAAESAPAVEAPAAPENQARAEESSASAPIEGSGPILGIPAPEEGGKIIGSSGTILPGEQPAPALAREAAAPANPIRVAQFALGALALLAAGAAVYIRLRWGRRRG